MNITYILIQKYPTFIYLFILQKKKNNNWKGLCVQVEYNLGTTGPTSSLAWLPLKSISSPFWAKLCLASTAIKKGGLCFDTSSKL